MVGSGTLVLASHNAGKRRELAPAFAALGLQLIDLDLLQLESPEETASTFLENALLKARHAAQHCDQWVLAEDSGICVPALGGAPGVRSARFAGDGASDLENNELLLQCLQALDIAQRDAYFLCVMVLLRGPEDPDPLVARGTWQGQIATERQGEGGFGYDPVFLPRGLGGRSAAQLSLAEKNSQSHRGQALRKLLAEMREQEGVRQGASSSQPPSTSS
ncbi:RdgB/HAM1 family non-canonical purine NTP pyrophosphatase [Acidithiobacillus sp. AMEEHan]|uniref:RdgB/HAM1 family non-canonical purine NTP pyrophosphatase n=1 Tax=Acidithiobacillus sp. AMEEHan TaxID=2994951 RepID=UPI0027E425A6|nr:RdgB/HAM1 family non-canonical purine NTP pyrophosphatase [Acidithiobacillus sp. AMEEHan]